MADRIRHLTLVLVLAPLLAAAAHAPQLPVAAPRTDPPTVSAAAVRATVAALAADSMEGRRVGTPGATRAARYIAGRLEELGIEPAGDSAYHQFVPLARHHTPRPDGSYTLRLLGSKAALDTVPAERRIIDANLVGIIRGSDSRLAGEAVVIGAHYDHVGIGQPVDGDSIYNGADDDASGVAVVLEVARALASGPKPRRTVVFLLSTGEEMGMLGTRWYADNPVVPLEKTVADLQVEMVGRPDSMAGGPGRAWLTGYERSTMGEMFAGAGLEVVPDPYPQMRFFMRSDNIVLAMRGVPAHTLSSYNLHKDYHTPKDEVERLDPEHLARVAETAIGAIRVLADSDLAPEWRAGGRPEGRR